MLPARLLSPVRPYRCLLAPLRRYASQPTQAGLRQPPQPNPPHDDTRDVAKLEALRELGYAAYPDFSTKSAIAGHSCISSIIQSQSTRLENGQWDKSVLLRTTGRVVAKRSASKKLQFLDIAHADSQLQLVAKLSEYQSSKEFQDLMPLINPGDVVEAIGYPGRTPSGELSIELKQIRILAPALRLVPYKLGFDDPESRFRKRYLDMLVNKDSVDRIRTRSKIIRRLREFLDSRGFVEVETPILSSQVGGANAKPFSTHMNDLHLDLQLRIAPELYLKQLVIGGLDRVYEIGKQFRNEGVDATHNPEFTTCEFYQAYSDLESMMDMTEELLRDICISVTGTATAETKIGSSEAPEQVVLDFGKPFQRIDIVPFLEEQLGQSLPPLNEQASLPELLGICDKHGIPCSPPHTLSRVIDKLISHFIEPICVQPTFLCGHPLVMSPLSKERLHTGTASRFELIIGRKEVINAYSELNDPDEQRRRFESQMKDRSAGDAEAQILDEDFVTALDYGLPPTVGWGLGIDRLCMLLTGSTRIRDVLAFPILKPVANPQTQ